ncbi:CotO family spore coat protein [Radiobacillus sp. PE A8.2]|uniref:CotO family spore coat protein n=1 Tax=Radiobacillus sp. PE A8.2 TaxID=3380349 RepID=UPI003890A86C
MPKKRKKHLHNPMLYITQPKLEKPSASMQSSYRTPKKRTIDKQSADATASNEKTIRRKKMKLKQESEQPAIEAEVEKGVVDRELDEHNDYNLEESEEKGTEQSNRKRFRDMTVEEKVNYFVSLPKQVPKMKCEVKTAEQSYRGVIYDYDNKVVFMVVIRGRKKIELDIDEIIDIRLMGF